MYFFNKISLNLNNYSLSKSLKKLVFIIWLIPYILISLISIFFLYNSIMKKELKIAQSSFEVAQNNLNGIIDNVQSFSDRIIVNQQIKNVIAKNYTNSQDLYRDYAALSFVDDYLRSMPEVSSYRIYVENQTLLDNSFIIKTADSLLKEDWYNLAIRLRGQTFWMYKPDTLTKKYHLCLIRSLWNTSTEKFLGVLVVNINSSLFDKRLASKLYNTILLINNKIFYSSFENSNISFTEQMEKKLYEIIKNYDFNNSKIIPMERINRKNCVLAYKFIPNNTTNLNIKIVFIVPFKNFVDLSLRILIISIVILISLGLLTILLLNMIKSHIDSRVNKIQTGIKNVVSNNFAIAPSIGGNDEFQEIYHSLYEMSNNIKSLINQVYTQNLEKEQLSSRQNEMRFKMLSTQINPHFLFNTLETIRMKSLASGDKDVATMLKQLASLLRYNLNITGKPVCFLDELTAVQNYLSIQQVRFGQRISHDIIILCDIRKIQIIPLLIQPIVENSFSHGLENTAENGFIYIFCEVIKNENSDEILRITVQDNGCGIEKEKLEELQRNLDMSYVEDNQTSIGIFNVNSRIKLFYGQQYGLNLKSEIGKGTSVIIEIPVVYSK